MGSLSRKLSGSWVTCSSSISNNFQLQGYWPSVNSDSTYFNEESTPWGHIKDERRTSNVEHRIMYSTIYNKDKAKRLPHSTFDVERSMFDVQIVASEITTKPSYHVEITYTGQEFWIERFRSIGVSIIMSSITVFMNKSIIFFNFTGSSSFFRVNAFDFGAA